MFYFMFEKQPKDMTTEELQQEIEVALSYDELDLKEEIRKEFCEIVLLNRPNGKNLWTRLIANI